jgi:hypothetical protein
MRSDADSATGDASACAVNIGPDQRRTRIRFGLQVSAVCALLAVVLIASGAPRLWRLVLLLPLWSGAIGFFQAREKT